MTPVSRIDYAMHEESRMLSTGLGNTRVMFGDNDGDGVAETLQEDHYYPAVYPENREPQNG